MRRTLLCVLLLVLGATVSCRRAGNVQSVDKETGTKQATESTTKSGPEKQPPNVATIDGYLVKLLTTGKVRFVDLTDLSQKEAGALFAFCAKPDKPIEWLESFLRKKEQRARPLELILQSEETLGKAKAELGVPSKISQGDASILDKTGQITSVRIVWLKYGYLDIGSAGKGLDTEPICIVRIYCESFLTAHPTKSE